VLAIVNYLKAEDILDAIHTYPTRSQITRRVANQRRRESLTSASRARMQRLFGLRGA
jgi:hypothetical protein